MHAKNILEMIEVALLKEFQESGPHFKISIGMFQKLKQWFIRPNKSMTHDVVDIALNSIFIMTHS